MLDFPFIIYFCVLCVKECSFIYWHMEFHMAYLFFVFQIKSSPLMLGLSKRHNWHATGQLRPVGPSGDVVEMGNIYLLLSICTYMSVKASPYVLIYFSFHSCNFARLEKCDNFLGEGPRSFTWPCALHEYLALCFFSFQLKGTLLWLLKILSLSNSCTLFKSHGVNYGVQNLCMH